MGQPVIHWEIGAANAQELKDFYTKLFDWDIQLDPAAGYGMVRTGGTGGIDGGIMQTREGMPPYLTFYVQVDDLDAYLQKSEALGGETIVPPTPIPGVGSFAMISDPEGHMIGIFKV